MYLHQNEFPERASKEVDGVALRALATLAATRSQIQVSATKGRRHAPKSAVSRLHDAAVAPDRSAIGSAIEDLRADGISRRTITSVIVPSVARQLGMGWEGDSTSFGLVTIGAARLQAVVRQLEETCLVPQMRMPTCLVVSPAGAQHTLGAVVLASQLRSAGARVDVSLDMSAEEMAQRIGSGCFDTVMVSAALGQDIDVLTALVAAARCRRRDSRGAVDVIIGGGLLAAVPDLAVRVNADHVSNDWQEAITLAAEGLP